MFGGFALRFSETLTESETAAGGRFANLLTKYGKPIVMHSIFAPLQPEALVHVRRGGIPLHASIEMAALCMGALGEYSDWRRKPPRTKRAATVSAPEPARHILYTAREEGRTSLLETEALDLLDAHGIATRPRIVVRTASTLSSYRALRR